MATSRTDSDKLTSCLAVTQYDFDPNGTDAVDIGWVDMRDFDCFMAMFFRTVGTSALDTFSIIANSESDGSGTDATILAHAVGSEPDAVGDTLVLEISQDQLREAETTATGRLRYVSVSAEFATGTDEGVVTYIRHGKRKYQDLTADNVA